MIIARQYSLMSIFEAMISCKHIRIDNQTIAYLHAGQSGATVFALHGNSGSADTWLPLIHALEPFPIQIIAVDLPGHGRSEKASDPSNDYTLTGLARTLSTFTSQLDVQNYIAVGHSLGGHLAHILLDSDPRMAGAITFGAPPLTIPLSDSLPHAFNPNPVSGLLFKADHTESEVEALAVCIDPIPSQDVILDIQRTDPMFRQMLGSCLGSGAGVADEHAILERESARITLIRNESDPLINPSYLDRYPTQTRHQIRIPSHSPHRDPAWLVPILLETIRSHGLL